MGGSLKSQLMLTFSSLLGIMKSVYEMWKRGDRREGPEGKGEEKGRRKGDFVPMDSGKLVARTPQIKFYCPKVSRLKQQWGQ